MLCMNHLLKKGVWFNKRNCWYFPFSLKLTSYCKYFITIKIINLFVWIVLFFDRKLGSIIVLIVYYKHFVVSLLAYEIHFNSWLKLVRKFWKIIWADILSDWSAILNWRLRVNQFENCEKKKGYFKIHLELSDSLSKLKRNLTGFDIKCLV